MEDITIEHLRRIQLFLAKLAVKEDRLPPKIKYVAGIDVAYTRDRAIAAAIVLDYDTLNVIEEEIVSVKCGFPYIPTLLSFREAPAVCEVIDRLDARPDVSLIDGQGIAHPFRCGLATYVGVLMQIPTIGVAKKLLCGEVSNLKGRWAPIIHEGEVVGAVLSKNRRKIYVSIGNMVSLDRAMEIVLHTMKEGALYAPLPLRLAHQLANAQKRMTG